MTNGNINGTSAKINHKENFVVTPRETQIVLSLFLLSLMGLHAFGGDTERPRTTDSEGRTYLLVARRPTIGSPTQQQKIGMAAVRRIAGAARKSGGEIVVDVGADTIMPPQHGSVESEEKVTGVVFKERLQRLSRIATSHDTVIIYTHSHGLKGGRETSQSLGGLVLDQPVAQGSRGGVIRWDEYAELVLDIPAKNVVVLTMSCFSGGLVDYLNSPPVKARWESRRQKEGRSLIVLTAQNAALPSGPIVKDSEIINPFTFAVSKMLAGDADGFIRTNGAPSENVGRDGELTAGEMIDYVLHTTENVTSEYPQLKNTAKPQLTGSFDRQDVLSFGAAEAAELVDHAPKQGALDATEEGGGEVDGAPGMNRNGGRDAGASRFRVARLFLQYDADGDGRITPEEATPVVANAFEKFDQDGDGIVDQGEFKAVAPRFLSTLEDRPSPQLQSRHIAALFSRNDADGDGKITPKEAKPVVANAFDEFDQDGDGAVDREEFEATFASRLERRRGGESRP